MELIAAVSLLGFNLGTAMRSHAVPKADTADKSRLYLTAEPTGFRAEGTSEISRWSR